MPAKFALKTTEALVATRYLGTTVWGVALLAASLFVGACGEDLPTDPPGEDDDNSTIGDDDDDDDEGRVDAGTSTKGDGGKPRADASKPSQPPPDEGDDDDDEGTPPDEGDDDDTTPSTGSDAGTQGRDAGKDATTGTTGDASTDDSDSGAAGERMDLGKGDGKDVITIGDSWMSLIGTGIQQSLVKVSGQPYRTYGVLGTRLLNEQIPNQYANAKRADPDIKTVVMTGGGNDILMNPIADVPATIAKIGKRLDELWTEMGKDGVLDVIYVEYSEGGSARDAANVRMGIAAVQPICDNHKALRCHFMLSDPIIMKKLSGDGIHPDAAGYDKLGKAVHELMIAEGMRR